MSEQISDRIHIQDRKRELGKEIKKSPMCPDYNFSSTDMATDLLPWIAEQIKLAYIAGSYDSLGSSIEAKAEVYAKEKGYL